MENGNKNGIFHAHRQEGWKGDPWKTVNTI